MGSNSMSSGKRKTNHALTQLAFNQLERLGVEPLKELYEALTFAKEKTLSGGNLDQNGKSDQSNFLALWVKSAETLAKFRYPTLSAVAVSDIGGKDSNKSLTTREAIEVIKNDPFAPKQIKEINTDRVLEAMNEAKNILPSLPSGERID